MSVALTYFAEQSNGGQQYRSWFDHEHTVNVDAAGWGKFTCSRGGLEVWVPSSDS